MITHAGGCHCSRVRFELQAPAKLEVLECNCIKSFYVPRGDPDSRSVNVRCLETPARSRG